MKIQKNKIIKRTNCYISRLKIISNYKKKLIQSKSVSYITFKFKSKFYLHFNSFKTYHEFTLKNNKYLHKKIQSDYFERNIVKHKISPGPRCRYTNITVFTDENIHSLSRYNLQFFIYKKIIN